MDLQLSDRQRQTVGVALTIVSAVVIVAAVGALVWLLALFVQTFSNVFLPLAVAGIAALVLKPYFEWLRRRMPAVLGVVVVFLSILIPLAAFFWFFGALVARQVSDLVHQLPELWHRLTAAVQERWPQVKDFLEHNPLGQRLRAAVEGQGDTVVQGVQFVGQKAWSVGAAVMRGAGAVFAWAVLPVYLVFFLLADAARFGPLERHLPFLKPETRQDLVFLLQEFVRILVSFFRGQLIVAFLMGVLFAVGFSAVGLLYGFILGLVLGFLNIIPYLGSIVGLAVALPLAFFQQGGGLWRVGAVILVFTAVQMIEGYLLTPKIMGDRTGLHPMVIIVAVFFWGTALGGIMGMILAIPLTAFLVVFWRLAREKYIAEWV